MAEQVKVPGIGEVPKPVLYGIVGVGGGVVVWAWWKRTRTPDTTAVAPDPQDLGAANYAGTGSSSAPIAVTNPNGGPGTFASNADWTQYAADKLAGSGGWDPGTILVALGKFLNRQGLTDAEIEIVTAAKGVAGDPPIGGPYTIIHALPTPTPTPTPTGGKLPAPGGFHANPGKFAVNKDGSIDTTTNYIDAAWAPVAGAVGYQYHEESAFGQQTFDLGGTWIHETGLTKPDTDHHLSVRAKDSSGQLGDAATLTVHTPIFRK